MKATVLENVQDGESPDAAREEVIEALRKCPVRGHRRQAAQEGSRHGDRDRRASISPAASSSGIAIARVMLKDAAPVLILDEATALRRPGQREPGAGGLQPPRPRAETVIMIAHRLSTVAACWTASMSFRTAKIAQSGSHRRAAGGREKPLPRKCGRIIRLPSGGRWEKRIAGRLPGKKPQNGQVRRNRERKNGKGAGKMMKKIQRKFALSEQGARDLVKACARPSHSFQYRADHARWDFCFSWSAV